MNYQDLTQPLYQLEQKKNRLIIPNIVIPFLLSVVFYLGILLNISFLELNGKTETTVKAAILVILIVFNIINFILVIKKSQKKYFFFNNRLYFDGKETSYQEIAEMKEQQNILDKWFGTYSLKLSPKFAIKNIPEELKIQNYIQQLINYSKQFS